MRKATLSSALVKMEFRMNFIGLLIWGGSLSAFAVLGLSFYPVLTPDSMVEMLGALFESPMMKTLLGAFGFDLESIRTISGFYVMYISIYFMMIAVVYAMIKGGEILSKEEERSTAEFLLTRPISRQSIFFSKLSVLIILIFLLNLMMTLSGLLGLRLFRNENSLTYNNAVTPVYQKAFESQPDVFRREFNLDEGDYLRMLLGGQIAGLEGDQEAIEESGIPEESLAYLIDRVMDDPVALMDEIQLDPVKYMDLLNLDRSQREDFMAEIGRSGQEIDKIRTELQQEPVRYVEIFAADPGVMMEAYRKAPEKLGQLAEKFGISEDISGRTYIYYQLKPLVILGCYIFLLLTLFAAMGLLISEMMTRGRPAGGIGIGLAFFFYFLDRITQLAGENFWPGKLSPFRWVNMDITDAAYHLEWERVLLLAGTAALMFFLAWKKYRSKDILI